MDQVERYKIRIAREKKARQEAERLLREKAHELYLSNLELKESQQALKEENKRYTNDLVRVQHLAKITSWRWNLTHKKITWSEEVSSLLELTPEQKNHSPFRKVIYFFRRCNKKTRTILMEFLRGVIEETANNPNKDKFKNETFGLEHDLIMPSGQVKNVRLMYEYFYNHEDQSDIIIGTLQDITTQKNYESILLENEKEANERVKELERLHEALVKAQVQTDLENQRKSEFLSTVNHELRTPLTSIHGSLELIRTLNKNNPQNRKSDELMEIAYRNSERLKFLVNDILDTEKIDSGNIMFNFADHKLEEILSMSIELNIPFAQKHNVTFNLSDTIPDISVRVDQDRFMQVITNLLSNAAKFSHSGGQVDITCEQSDKMVTIAIRDYGLGMPDSFKDTIFQKFSQADMSDTRKREGTGLGLYITKSIIERHKGLITYESELNKGTVFFITLPYIKTE